MSRERLEVAVSQIEFARSYTLQLLDDVTEDEWFRHVDGCPSHLAWQVGHLAMAQYALTMVRIRGKEPEDEQLLSKNFFRRFQKGTKPVFDVGEYPPIDEIRETLARVHEASLGELQGHTDDSLSESLPAPTAVYDTKLGSIIFCSMHEMLHAGQIGIIRRLLGKEPVR